MFGFDEGAEFAEIINKLDPNDKKLMLRLLDYIEDKTLEMSNDARRTRNFINGFYSNLEENEDFE